MKLVEMREQVLAELDHIPKRPKPDQSYLRMFYFTSRMSSLGKKAEGEMSAFDVLQQTIEYLKKERPGSKFVYEETFFSPKPGT